VPGEAPQLERGVSLFLLRLRMSESVDGLTRRRRSVVSVVLRSKAQCCLLCRSWWPSCLFYVRSRTKEV